MAPTRNIFAIGGGMFSTPEQRLLRHILAQSGKAKPRVCFFPHASDNNAGPKLTFYELMSQFECTPSTLSLLATPPASDLAQVVLNQDVILVGGGNTVSMLALWRAWGLDNLLRQAWHKGTVLAGVSAGGNCWFESCVTDSLTVELAGWGGCLGFLRGSFCPHFDSEASRRPTYQRLVSSAALPGGIACDDFAAAHFVDDALHAVVSAAPGAGGYRVHAVDGAAVIDALPVHQL
jgi:dipeptidase E